VSRAKKKAENWRTEEIFRTEGLKAGRSCRRQIRLSSHGEKNGDVVSLLSYFVVVHSTFRIQMAKQCVAHIFQRRICLNSSHGSADGWTIDVHPSDHVGSRNPQLPHG
jgi:hypothetical protein